MADTEAEERARLTRLRLDQGAWQEVACEDGTDDEGLWTDRHAIRRYGVLLALQYDLLAADRELVRFLLQQETLRHRREPFQGLAPALKLAAFLLASYQQVEHVWDFAEAKRANFDTILGFDAEYLLSAGIDTTLAYVSTHEHPQRDSVLEWIVSDGRCILDERDISAWWSHQKERFPSRREEEQPKARLDQALQLGDLQEARRWLRVWESGVERTVSTLHRLAWYWAVVEDWDHATDLTEELLALPGVGDILHASGLVHLVEYRRRGGQKDEAWHALQAAISELNEIDDWWQSGYGRSAVEEALLLAQAFASEGSGTAQIPYSWAAHQLARPYMATVHLLEIAEVTAGILGEGPSRRRYHKRARRGRRHIERELQAREEVQ